MNKKILLIILLAIIIVSILIIIVNTNNTHLDSNSYVISKEIIIDEDSELTSYLILSNWNDINSGNIVHQDYTLETIHTTMEETLETIPFYEIDTYLLNIPVSVFSNNENLVSNANEIESNEDFYFETVQVYIIDEQLNEYSYQILDIVNNEFSLDISNLQNDTNYYIRYVLTPVYENNSTYGSYIEYAFKINVK